MKKIFLLAILIFAAAYSHASSNPDGGLWIPSFNAAVGYLPRFEQERAHFNSRGEEVVATQLDSFNYQVQIVFPVMRAFSLGASFGETEDYQQAISSTPLHVATSDANVAYQVDGFDLAIYGQGFLPEREILWGPKGGPDGDYWIPNLHFHVGYTNRVIKQNLYLDGGEPFARSSSQIYYTDGLANFSLPLPGDWLVSCNYYQGDLNDFLGDWNWGVGMSKHLDFFQGSRWRRGWNPDGRVGSIKASLGYAQTLRHGGAPEDQLFSGGIDYVLCNFATFGLSVEVSQSQTDEIVFNGLQPDSIQVNRTSSSWLFRVKFYAPRTIPRKAVGLPEEDGEDLLPPDEQGQGQAPARKSGWGFSF